MHKILLLTCGILISASVAIAADCANGAGTIITGKNSTTYCKSKNQMNWWTAINWCHTIGMQPITYPADCTCTGPYCPTEMTGCPNFTGDGNGWVWTGTPCASNGAYIIDTKSGTVYHPGFHASTQRHNKFPIICKQ